MTIDLESISALTKLTFSKEEVPPLMEAIKSVTLLAEDFDKCELPSQEQESTNLQAPTAFFDGTPCESCSAQQLLQNTAAKANGCIIVPKTVE